MRMGQIRVIVFIDRDETGTYPQKGRAFFLKDMEK